VICFLQSPPSRPWNQKGQRLEALPCRLVLVARRSDHVIPVEDQIVARIDWQRLDPRRIRRDLPDRSLHVRGIAEFAAQVDQVDDRALGRERLPPRPSARAFSSPRLRGRRTRFVLGGVAAFRVPIHPHTRFVSPGTARRLRFAGVPRIGFRSFCFPEAYAA
jgi:hypothetical protein